jgi:hypothetical protein
MEVLTLLLAGVVLLVVIWVFLIQFGVSPITVKTAGFRGGLRSNPQAVNLGPSRMSRRSEIGYDGPKYNMSFLGGPMGGEAPIFYDIGDISATQAAIGSGNYSGGDDGTPVSMKSTAESFASRKKHGFADLDEMLVRSSR